MSLSTSLSLSLSFPTYSIAVHLFLCTSVFRSVNTSGNGGAVLLAEPAQVAHGLHHYHMMKELLPEGGKDGVAHWPLIAGTTLTPCVW